MLSADEFKISGKVDKRGRQIIPKEGQNQELCDYYYLDSESEAKGQTDLQGQTAKLSRVASKTKQKGESARSKKRMAP